MANKMRVMHMASLRHVFTSSEFPHHELVTTSCGSTFSEQDFKGKTQECRVGFFDGVLKEVSLKSMAGAISELQKYNKRICRSCLRCYFAASGHTEKDLTMELISLGNDETSSRV